MGYLHDLKGSSHRLLISHKEKTGENYRLGELATPAWLIKITIAGEG